MARSSPQTVPGVVVSWCGPVWEQEHVNTVCVVTKILEGRTGPAGHASAARVAVSRAGFPISAVPATKPPPVVKERRPAPSALLHERLDPRRSAIVVRARQQPGG